VKSGKLKAPEVTGETFLFFELWKSQSLAFNTSKINQSIKCQRLTAVPVRIPVGVMRNQSINQSINRRIQANNGVRLWLEGKHPAKLV
jgi:hypothetical protein